MVWERFSLGIVLREDGDQHRRNVCWPFWFIPKTKETGGDARKVDFWRLLCPEHRLDGGTEQPSRGPAAGEQQRPKGEHGEETWQPFFSKDRGGT